MVRRQNMSVQRKELPVISDLDFSLLDMATSHLVQFGTANEKLGNVCRKHGMTHLRCVAIPIYNALMNEGFVRVKAVTSAGTMLIDDDWIDFPTDKLIATLSLLSRTGGTL